MLEEVTITRPKESKPIKDETIKKLLFVIKYTFMDFIKILSPIFKIFIIPSTWKTWRKQNFICISFGFN